MDSRTRVDSASVPGVTQVSGRFGPGSAHTAARGKPMNNLQLVENLCARSTVLNEARRTHVKSFGALIPHVFMGSVLARVGICILAGKKAITDHGPEVAAILESLEQGLAAGDRETRNVICVSFVNDGELEPFFAALKPLLGPRVLAQLQGR
jgi:hypothetical protein